MNSKLFLPVSLMAMVSLFFSSCSNYEKLANIELDELDYEAEFALPLVNSNLNLKDILEGGSDFESFVEIDDAGNMTLVYNSKGIEFDNLEVMADVPDFPLVLPEMENTFPFGFVGQVQAEEMLFKSGTVSFSLKSMETSDLDVNITFPDIIKNGVPLTISTTIVYDGSSPATTTIDNHDLEGYLFNLSGNDFEINYEAFTPSGTRVALSSVTGMAEGWAFSYIKGNWGNTSFEASSRNTPISFFENSTTGNISFAEPSITIYAQNSFGVPLQLNFNTLGFIGANGDPVYLDNIKLENGLTVAYPELGEMGSEAVTSMVLNRSNSNIDDILNAFPNTMFYNVAAEINPDNNDATGFVTDESKLTVKVGVELPLIGTASDFKLENLAETDFAELENVHEATFKLITANNFPFDVNLQLEFLDADQQLLFRLFPETEELLTSASVDASGEVTAAATDETIIPINSQEMTDLKLAKFVHIKAGLSTFNDGQENVRLKNTQGIEVKLGVRAIVGQ